MWASYEGKYKYNKVIVVKHSIKFSPSMLSILPNNFNYLRLYFYKLLYCMVH